MVLSPTLQLDSKQQIRVYLNENHEVLDVELWSSCLFNRSWTLVVLIHVAGLFLGIIYWLMRYLGILSVRCGIQGCYREEKPEVPSDISCGATPARAPQGRLVWQDLEHRTSQSATKPGLFDRPWRPTPLKAPIPPWDLVLSLSFPISTKVRQLSFLVDFNTQIFI